MSEIYSWSASAGGNTSAPPDGAPEGMLRPTVNDVMREMMASLRRWYQILDWSRPHGGAVTTRDSAQVVRVAGADYTGFFTAGRRIQVSGGGTREGVVVSSTFSAGDTLVTVRLEPTSFAELAAGINLTFADVGAADTITAASGTPFSGVSIGDRVRVEKQKVSHVNSGTKLVAGVTSTILTLDSAESLTNEGPTNQKIYLESVGVPVGTNLILLARWGTSSSAHRNIGVAAGEIPTNDRLGSSAYVNTGPTNGLDADTVDGQHAADLLDNASARIERNLLINSGFRRWQRGTTFTNVVDATYTADQWKALVQTANGCTLTKETSDKPTGSRAAAKLTSNAAGGKFGLIQFVEAEDCFELLGLTGTFSIYLKADASIANARLILVTWSGTEDAIAATASDVISVWNAAGANPTMVANVTIEASSQVAVTGSWQRFTLSGAFDTASGKNVGILVLVDDDAITVGHALFAAQAQLELGSAATPYGREPWERVLAKTDRFFAKTFLEGTAPAQNAGLAGAIQGHNGSSFNNNEFATWQFPTRMLATPTTVVTYNPSAANANWTSGNAAALNNLGDAAVSVVANAAVTSRSEIHLTAEAPLF